MLPEAERCAMQEAIQTGEHLGLLCKTCQSPMHFGERDRRLMMCSRDAGCSHLIVAPPIEDIHNMARTRFNYCEDTGRKYRGKCKTKLYRGRVLYTMARRDGEYIRGVAGSVVALRFTKRTCGAELFLRVDEPTVSGGE